MTDICYPKKSALLSAEEAQQRIQTALTSIAASEWIPLNQALGRMLADDVSSPIDIPPERNAAMDGYAFASSDIVENQAFELEVAGYSWAGKPFAGQTAARQCVRIFTGAVVPSFTDSVIAQEQVELRGETILFPADTVPFKNIRAAGSDVKCGDPLLAPPRRLSAVDIGLLAAAGISRVAVRRRLKIAHFSTGDELTPLGQTLASGQIYDSNRYLLSGLLADPDFEVTDLGIVADDTEQLEQTLIEASARHDVIISTGGASVGEADFIKQTLEKCGEVDFWKLAIKPGKPLAFGRIGQCHFFGLPGNPVAVLVTFQTFVKPALSRLAGAPQTQPLQLRARCDSSLKKSAGRQEYQRGILRQIAPGEFAVALAGPQDSHQLKVASLANCFIVLEADCCGVKPGETVTVAPWNIVI